MKILLITLCLLLPRCYVDTKKIIKDFKPGSTTELVNRQDSLLTVYKSGTKIPKYVADSLSKNTWVAIANQISPNNIVIRQHCLIDLINGEPTHHENIERNVKILSYNGEIWAEGYSYWEYVRYFLEAWAEKFVTNNDIIDLIPLMAKIETGFIETAYIRDTLCYPAPFGDLRDVPLHHELQKRCFISDDSIITRSILTVTTLPDYIQYKIEGNPVGLNSHVPKDTFYVEVRNGIPNFEFYTGYSNKYKNEQEELMDMFDVDRIMSIKEY